MRKLVLALIAAVVAGSAAAALSMGAGSADPASNSTYNVVGEPYARAVAILRAQGVKTSFGGSVGSDVPQSQCVVSSQKVTGGGTMQLMLNCTEAAQPEQPAATSAASAPGAGSTDAGGRPTAGAPGVVTVVATPVG
ncbi:hypothetical protein [Mycolicibacterium sp.]|uniref:hypothetical protein n=1 Tax=Mycolicibacterium sp. TaxID=2320850 RepID=UPI001A2E41DA|nr:hypothetical protein [Mycolicibacterium sp.]MBJ7398892.1 hypothetical protein [Mycolicibacterium sp.]